MAFNQVPNSYFKDLFLKNYRTPEDAKEQASNTDEFAMWLIANPEQFNPIFKWFINFYFNGLDENAKAIAFEDDVIRCAKAGVTKPLFIDVTAQGSVENYSLFGIMCLFFKEPYDFDQEEVDYVTKLLEDIRLKSELFTWKRCDWDYFLEKHWYVVCSDILNKLASDYNALKDSFLIKETTEVLEKKRFGVPVEFIAKDDNFDPPHSGYGIDLSKFFPNQNRLIITMSECTHHANSCDADLTKQSLA